jgi:hypothetical protein
VTTGIDLTPENATGRKAPKRPSALRDKAFEWPEFSHEIRGRSNHGRRIRCRFGVIPLSAEMGYSCKIAAMQ